MRFLHFLGLIASFFVLMSCKSKDSELKATEAQRSKLKSCIVSTVMESYASSNPDRRAVGLFADDLARRAPSDNEIEKDPKFEEYVGTLGCDPKKVGSKDSFGTTIVVEWAVSPLNPKNANSANTSKQ